MIFGFSHLRSWAKALFITFYKPLAKANGKEYPFNYKNSLGSVIFPVTAAAAAVSGLASSVRAPGP
jgi:hypothetical protein